MSRVEAPIPQDVKVNFILHGNIPEGYRKDYVDKDGGHGIYSVEEDRVNEQEERIINAWIIDGIEPSEDSGFLVINNRLWRQEDLQRELKEQLEHEEWNVTPSVAPTPEPVSV